MLESPMYNNIENPNITTFIDEGTAEITDQQEENIRTAFAIAKTIVGTETEIFLYAGKVRNLLLGKKTSNEDYDFIGNFDPNIIEERFPELIQQKWENVSTIRLNIGNDNYDFTWTDDLEKHLYWGDITISNICIDQHGKIIDTLGAMDDIKNQQIRVIEPDLKFIFDPSRIIRVARLSAELGFKIEEETLESIKRLSFSLRKTTKFQEELKNIDSLEEVCRRKIYNCLEIDENSSKTSIDEEQSTKIIEAKLQEINEIYDVEKMFKTDVYLIGGAVRDTIWNKNINDLDFKVNLPISDIIKTVEQNGFIKRDSYQIGEKEYYISSFQGVIGIKIGNYDMHLAETITNKIDELIKEGDLNFNCCAYDIHSKRIINPSFINEIKSKELRFANPQKARSEPTIIINALKQIAKLPEIGIPEETKLIIHESIPQTIAYMYEHKELEYLFKPIFFNLNSGVAVSFLRNNEQILLRNINIKKEKLLVSSKDFYSQKISDLPNTKREAIYSMMSKAYRESFEKSKFLSTNLNSLVYKEKAGEILSCALVDDERIYSFAAKDSMHLIELIREIKKNNYNIWGTIDYNNTKIRALCMIAGLKIENNKDIIENILKTKCKGYQDIQISTRKGLTVFTKSGQKTGKWQILVRS